VQLESEVNREAGQHDDADEGRRHTFGHEGKQIDDRKTGRDHRVGLPSDVDELRKLRQENQNCERIDETGNDRTRYELHQQAETREAGNDLNEPHQDCCGEQILQAMVAHQCDHQHRGRCRRGRNHGGPAADNGGHHRDRERCVKPDFGVDTGNNREADRLGDEGEGDKHAREQFGGYIREPVTAERLVEPHCFEKTNMYSEATGGTRSTRTSTGASLKVPGG